jgi:hypothetical protein
VGLAGCGGSDKKPASAGAGIRGAPVAPTVPSPTGPTGAAPAVTATTPAKPPVRTTTSPSSRGGGGGGGGGGGTEPARTELTFNATAAGISPKQAGVAPFIAVRVTLVSKDGKAHTLAFGGRRVAAAANSRATIILPGIGPGHSYVGRFDGGTTVRILSTSEPGP